VSLANLSVLFPMGHNWSQALLVDSTAVGRKMWGKDLVFSVWTRSIGIEGRAYILLQAYRDTISKMSMIWGVDRDAAQRRLNIKPVDDPLIDLGWKRQFFTANETQWVRREVRVYCPPSVNVIFVRLGMQGTGQVMFDEASLTVEDPLPAKAPAPGENLLAEPGFEDDGAAWEFSIPAYRGMRIDVGQHRGPHGQAFGALPERRGRVRDRALRRLPGDLQPRAPGQACAAHRLVQDRLAPRHRLHQDLLPHAERHEAGAAGPAVRRHHRLDTDHARDGSCRTTPTPSGRGARGTRRCPGSCGGTTRRSR
jgi:hypothetical protein